MSETVLVYGGTGMQGKPIVKALAEKGFAVNVLTRQQEVDFGTAEHITLLNGDLSDLASLEAANKDIDYVVLTLPLMFDEVAVAQYVDHVISAAKKMNVKQIIFNTSIPVPASKTGNKSVDMKLDALVQFRASGLNVTTIQPTLYLGNLAGPWTVPGIVKDGTVVYPLASEVACSWISWEDTAQAISAVTGKPEFYGEDIKIGGPKALTGADLAAAIAKGRGKAESFYVALPVDDFAGALNAEIGEPVGTEIASLYAYLADAGAASLNVRPDWADRLGISITSADEWASFLPWEVLLPSNG